MPSFTTSDNQYVYFYHRWVQKGVERNVFRGSNNTICSFIKTSSIILLSFLLSTSWNYLLDRIHGHHQYFRYNTKLNIIVDIIQIFCMTLCIHIILILLLTTHNKKYDNIFHRIINDKDYALIIRLAMSIFICSSIASIPAAFRESLNNSFIIDTNSSTCTYVNCEYFSIYQCYVFIILPTLIPLLLYTVYVILLSIKNCCNKSSKRQSQAFQMRLLDDIQTRSVSDSFVTWKKTEILQSENEKLCQPHIINITFLLFLSLTITIGRIQANVVHHVESHAALIYLQFTFWCCISKYIMKKLARKIDKYRVKNENDYYLNFEYLMEWIMNVMYWSWWKRFVAYKTQTGAEFTGMLLLHFVLESINGNIKFTGWYYDVSLKFYDLIPSSSSKFQRDKSDKTEWRNRLSMDLVCRFYALLLIGIFELFCLLFQGERLYEERFVENSDGYWVALSYVLISVVLEFVHYCVTFYVIGKTTLPKAFTVTNAFMDYIAGMTCFHLTVMAVVYYAFFVFSFLY